MKTDVRTRYTKQAIRTALFLLLEQKSIEKITVKEICELAELNRATFYRYYDNQYDLLSQIEKELLEDIRAATQNCSNDVDALIKEMFRLLFQNKNEWCLLMGQNGDLRLVPKLYNFFDQNFEFNLLSENQKMRYRFMTYGFSGIFDYWVKNNMQESPETMAAYLITYRHDLLL